MTTATSNATEPTTVDKLAEMLQENTGRHFLDSGGAYGRNWERNAGRDFAAEPEGKIEFYQRGEEVDIIATVSVFHFLRARVEYNAELDAEFRAYLDREELDADMCGAESFAHSLEDSRGLYGDGEPVIVNTYNGENLLSQVLQYVYWEDDNGAHVLLQIHGGCDVRGGYTDPVAFDVEETAIFDNDRASIYCDDCNHYWDTDDANNWYQDGCCGKGFTNLEDYPTTDTRPGYPEKRDHSQRALPIDLPQRPEPCPDVLWIDDDENGHCPYCGGLLHLAPQSC